MTTPDPFALWVYLSASPLTWLAATLAAYLAADRVSSWLGRPAIGNPVLLSVLILGAVLALTGTDYRTYFDGAQFVHFMLGPATVALAVPLVAEARRVRRMLLPMLAALFAGATTAIVSAVGVAWALGASPATLASLAPKSVTTPVAMAIAESTGGIPALTAVLVLLTGVLGAVLVTPLLNRLGIRDWAARGFAAGIAAHGLGTARAFLVSPLAGTFAGLALALNALVTALLVPLLLRLFRD
jgi:predicted murein hydrolase (TIGR00659 family)